MRGVCRARAVGAERGPAGAVRNGGGSGPPRVRPSTGRRTEGPPGARLHTLARPARPDVPGRPGRGGEDGLRADRECGADDTRSATAGKPAAQGDAGGTAGPATERPAPQGDTERSDDAGDTVDAGDAVDVHDADDTGDAGGTRSTTAASPAAQDPAGEVVAAETSGAPRGRGAGARLARLRAWRERYPRAARVVWWTTTVLSVVLLYLALLLPVPLTGFEPRMLLRLPGEAVVVAAVLTALPRRPRGVVAALGGAGLAALTVVNLLDMGFGSYLGRGSTWSSTGSCWTTPAPTSPTRWAGRPRPC